jgi:uncharacterized protein
MELKDIKFKNIELSDKKIFDDHLNRFQPEASEFTFTNLFAWRIDKGYEFAIFDDHILVKFRGKKEDSPVVKFLQPVGEDPGRVIAKIIDMHPKCRFERVEEKIALRINKFSVEEDPDNNDYVYNVNELSRLEGKNFEAKRNFIRQCEQYGPEICTLDEESVHEFINIQERWCDVRKCEASPELDAENTAIREALINYSSFDLFGICIRINNRIEAFAIGEKLNDDTFVEHFEKASPDFKGLYQFVLNAFAKKIPGSIEFLNREQDLGVAGLRKAKRSWNHVRTIKKYVIRDRE